MAGSGGGAEISQWLFPTLIEMFEHMMTHDELARADDTCSHGWRWSGTRYARMANDWLDNFDRHRGEIERILRLVHERNSAYGCGAGRWLSVTAGLFVYVDGSKWGRESLSNGRR
ncbi:hypothetical protein [Tardiphaga sp. OK245]|uniref:hypothetical protein n=1 Tax=Tardiphaga sp. OK245 TaxID=1855306 RepID=UPI000B8763CF|nr:hypothetical protein [Tardiphaga sp. OK245]